MLDSLSLSKMSTKEAFRKSQDILEGMSFAQVVPGTNKLVKDSDSSLFLSNALEKIDPVIHKPLSRFYWQDAMPVMYGGGALEFSSFFRVNYNAQDTNKNVASGNANIITEVKATIQKFQTVVKPYAWSIETGWIDEMKLRQVNSSILQQIEEGVRLYYNQKLDDVAFFGFVNEGQANAYGLLNNPNVPAMTADDTFENLSPSEIVSAMNELLAAISLNTEYNQNYRVNHILLPASVYTILAQPMTIGAANGVAVFANVLEYFKANNYIKMLFGSDDLVILPLPYLETAGAGQTKRMVAYCYDEACVRMPLPMDLTRGATMFDVGAMAYKTVYVTFVGHPQFVYAKTVGYLDNI